MAGSGSNKAWSFMVDKDLRPAYYDRFHCLAADCKLSCCIGWSIPFDKKDYLAMKHQRTSPELAERLEKALRRVRDREKYGGSMYAEFDMSSGVCPLLRQDCLCALQAEKGPDALPAVCRIFPRGERYQTSGYLHRSLSPACEGVLALLWDLPSGVDFISDPLPKTKQRKLMAEKDTSLYRYFGEIQELCIDFLQDRRFPLPRRMLMLGMALQKLADGETDIPGWLARSRAMADTLATDGSPKEPEQEKLLAMCLTDVIQSLYTFETADPELQRVKDELIANSGVFLSNGDAVMFSLAPYRAARMRFEEKFGDRAYFFENLMVTLLFHLDLPDCASAESLWKSYVNLCNLYAFYRFAAVMCCREGAAGDRDELFRMMVFISRALIHNSTRRAAIRDELFRHGSATLAHMAVLLGG